MKEIKTVIAMKRDTLQNWMLNDPVLHDGELAIVWISPEEVRLKVGDGERRFLDLPYISFGANSLTGIQ